MEKQNKPSDQEVKSKLYLNSSINSYVESGFAIHHSTLYFISKFSSFVSTKKKITNFPTFLRPRLHMFTTILSYMNIPL